MHVATLQNDLVASLVRTVVRLKLGENGVAVVPVIDQISALLLLVERDTESDGLVRVVREWSLADQIAGALELGLHTLCAEVAAKIVIVVEEVVSPDLNDSAAIFGAVARVDGMYPRVVVVSEGLTVGRVSEVSGERDHDWHDLGLVHGGRVVALQAPSGL